MIPSAKAFIGMPCYTDSCANAYAVKRASLENGLIGVIPFAFEPAISSALPYTFNLLWAKALAGGFDYFFMLHADIVPTPGWAKKLLDILLEHDADVVSACSPIKSEQGVFSVGVGDPANRWGPYYRFTAKQLAKMPETFGPEDTDCPDKPLVVNTGCWVANLKKPWVRETNADGELAITFDMRHRIVIHKNGKLEPQMEPEDWRFSRDLAARGCKVLATKAIDLNHFGTKAWNSKQVWGDDIDRLANAEYAKRFIGDHGQWLVEHEDGKAFDASLAEALAVELDGSVLDAGCGRGHYVSALVKRGINVVGVDGNPGTGKYDNCHCCDLALPAGDKYSRDWVLSLEVGEHIPEEHEDVYLDNIARFATRGIVLSWAAPGQPGVGHVNCRPQSWVIEQMADRGFVLDLERTDRLREASTLLYLRTNILVFTKADAAW